MKLSSPRKRRINSDQRSPRITRRNKRASRRRTRVQRLVHKQLRLTTRYLVISAASKSRLFCSPVSLSMRLPMELVSCVASFANRNATPKLHASYTARPIFIVYNLSSRCDNSSSNTRASHYSRTYLHLRFKI